MKTCVGYIISLLIFYMETVTSNGNEYCMRETFHAECQDDQVIMMTESVYGMMEKNRCVKPNDDMRDLGCSADALTVMDASCSNRQICEFYIPEPALIEIGCSTQVASLYLQATYECFTVERPLELRPCTTPREIVVVNSNGYISSTTATSDKGWGSVKCLWIITAMPGQTIDITVIDFQASGSNQNCQVLGHIQDLSTDNEVPICKSAKRKQHVFTSTGTKVEVTFQNIGQDNTDILLHYMVVGCADIIAPDNAWYKRQGNIATIGCHKQNKTWHLRCDGERWQGVVGSCDDSDGGVAIPPDKKGTGLQDMFQDIPMEIVVTIAAGIVVLVFVCIIALCVRWKLKSRQNNNQAIYNQSTVSSSGGYAAAKPHTRSSWACTYKAGRQHQVDTHIWETPLPDPSTQSNEGNPQSDFPAPAAMLDSMEYTMPAPTGNPQADASNTFEEYTQPIKTKVNPDYKSTANDQTLDIRHSQANYYYYDPSTTNYNYMQPLSSAGRGDPEHKSEGVSQNTTDLPDHETMNPVYKQ